MKKKLVVAVVGAGMGGLAVTATLHRAGIAVSVYEQA
jgi:phytoene dehydrogenase-like protein